MLSTGWLLAVPAYSSTGLLPMSRSILAINRLVYCYCRHMYMQHAEALLAIP